MGRPEYEKDSADGLRREVVGSWAIDKHALLAGYVDACRAARGKLGGTPCYVDLYCGPGRVRIRGENSGRAGGVFTAVSSSQNPTKGVPVPFAKVFVADTAFENIDASVHRLASLSVPIESFVEKAEIAVDKVVRCLPRKGLHFAYLDPYAIDALPFDVIRKLAGAGRIDFLIHFASSDLRRNLLNSDHAARFEAVAPGWGVVAKAGLGIDALRLRYYEHWKGLISGLGFKVAVREFRVTNSKNAELYRLLMASKNPLAEKLWSTLGVHSPQLF